MTLASHQPYMVPAYVRVTGGARVGLFETSTDVDNCIARVDAQIRSLDADAQAEYKKRYGPAMFAATIATAEELEQFRADRAFYQSWLGFKNTWDAFVEKWRDRYISVMSADKFRECMNYDLEHKAWRPKFTEQGIHVTAPETVTPSILPGVIPPKAPGQAAIPWGWLIFGVVLIGGAVFLGQVRGVVGAGKAAVTP
jgi:hypothetical protein